MKLEIDAFCFEKKLPELDPRLLPLVLQPAFELVFSLAEIMPKMYILFE